MVNCTRIISRIVPPTAIMSTPATCPAEVRFVAEISEDAITESPALTAFIPNPNDTDNYPKEIGMPWDIPRKKSDFK